MDHLKLNSKSPVVTDSNQNLKSFNKTKPPSSSSLDDHRLFKKPKPKLLLIIDDSNPMLGMIKFNEVLFFDQRSYINLDVIPSHRKADP